MIKTLLFFGFLILTSFLYSQDYQDLNFNDIGQSQMSIKRYPEAIFYFDKAIKINPGNSIYYLNRGYCYFNIEEYENAIKDFLHCSKMIPDEAHYYYLAGLCYNKLGNIDLAIINYNKAIDFDNNSFEYYYHRGIAFMKIDSIENSIEDFTNSIELNPGHSSSYYNRGQSQFKLKLIENACIDWQVALSLDSNLVINQYNKNCKNQYLGVWKDFKTLPNDIKHDEPSFQGGAIEDFRKYVTQNLRYPDVSEKGEQQRRTISKFIVRADGKITNITMLSSVSEQIDNEVKRVIGLTKNMWNGGKINGIPTDFEYTFQIPFLNISTFETIKKFSDNAEKAIKNQDYSTAIDNYNEIIKIDPLDINTLRNRAIANIKLGNKSEAEKDWKSIMNLDIVRYKLNPFVTDDD